MSEMGVKKNFLFDREGKNISMKEFDTLLQDDKYRQVALDRVGDLVVSTVWTGVSIMTLVGAPRIFETMAFDGYEIVDGPIRVASEAQAINVHEAVCRKVLS